MCSQKTRFLTSLSVPSSAKGSTPTSYPIRPPNPLEYFVDEGGTKYQGEKSLASLFVWKVFN
jgi:hypothetical protein